MSWWRQDEVKITHLPTGHVVRAEFGRSIFKMRERCVDMLRGKLWAWPKGPPAEMPLVRSYDLTGGDVELVRMILDGDIPAGERKVVNE